VQTAPNSIAQLDTDHPFEGLTPKQYRFVTTVFSGKSYADAYREHYDCEGLTETVIRQRAATVANEPLVKVKLRELRLQSDANAILVPLATREFVVQQLVHLTLNAEKESVQLGAVTQLGKVRGVDAFTERTIVEHVQRTPEDVDKELKEKLANLAKTIEGTAARVESPGGSRRKPRAPRAK